MPPHSRFIEQEQQLLSSNIAANGFAGDNSQRDKQQQQEKHLKQLQDEQQQQQQLLQEEQQQPEQGLSPFNSHNHLTTKSPKDRRPIQIVWRNVILMSALHLGALVGLKQIFTTAQIKTTILAYILYNLGGLGITAGAHRLWSHRSYKAKWPLRIMLCCFQTLAFQNSIYEWSRDHRTHHKFSETDADPHDATRGFFFSHVGWLLCRKHPQVQSKGKTIDLGDLWADPIVRFQHHYYLLLMTITCFVVPTLIPYYLWGESLYNAFYICALLRYTVTLHATWLVNSAAHMWGRRPYDKNINPSENRGVSLAALGEGFHNYHHTFPWDYATSELGYELNLTKLFIDSMSAIGWAYERKVVKADMVKQRKHRTGDDLGPYGPNN